MAGDSDDSLKHLHLWQFQAVRDVLLVATAAGLVWLGYAMRAVTVPLLVALLLAYLFEPLVARASRHRRLSRPMVVGGLLMTVGALTIGLLTVVIGIAVGQTVQLAGDYREGGFRVTAERLVDYLPDSLHEDAQDLIDRLPLGPATGEPPVQPDESSDRPVLRAGPTVLDQEQIREIVREEMKQAGAGADEGGVASARWLGLARGGAHAAALVIAGIVQIGFLAFLIPFYFFFFSVWYPAVVRFGRSLIPTAHRDRSLHLLRQMDEVVAGFVRGRIVVSLIMGMLLSVGWWAVGVPYSVVLGVVVGLFCAVPYLGAVGVPVAIGLLAFGELGSSGETMSWWGIVLWPSLVYAVVQIFEGYVLIPVIAGKATNLDPVTILVVVLAGGSLMGVYGMLLAIPVAACIKIVCTDVLLPKIRAWTKGEAADPLPLER